ncbi:MAG: hypothetical protein mread185_000327 [Mycoplasmataceae bacterium]|nr:MAG: hypothetical protein mread185_000327 [Mycoplasmataceae bacterium]
MVNAQQWLDNVYSNNPHNRREVKFLNLSSRNLSGDLKIENFPKLTNLNCSFNNITGLTIVNCPNLTLIDVSENPIIKKDFTQLGSNNYELVGWKEEVISSSEVKKFVNDFVSELLQEKQSIIEKKEQEIKNLKRENQSLEKELLEFKIKEKKLDLEKKINKFFDNELGYFVFMTYFRYNDESAEKFLEVKFSKSDLAELIKKQREISELEEKLVLHSYDANRESNIYDIENIYSSEHLDILARLLTGNERCVAICFYEGNLLLANNSSFLIYSKHYLEKLRDFLSTPSSDQYKELLFLSLENIRNASDNHIGNFLDYKQELTSLRRFSSEQISRTNWVFIQYFINQIFQKIINDKKGTKFEVWWKFLERWYDTKKIALSVIDKNLDSKIFEAIKNKKIVYLERQDEWSEVHAEMKIVDFLFKRQFKKKTYIGISKPTCLDCQSTINSLNKKGYSLLTYGEREHGGKRDGWIAPNFLTTSEAQEIKYKNLLPTIKKATTSEIPNNLSEINATSLFEKLENHNNYQRITENRLNQQSMTCSIQQSFNNNNYLN